MQFEVTHQEANVIIEALGNMPYVKVFELIHKLQQQAQTQLQQNQQVVRESASPKPQDMSQRPPQNQ